MSKSRVAFDKLRQRLIRYSFSENSLLTNSMSGNRERLAWAIILMGFTILIAVLIAIPISLNAIRLRATRPLNIFVQANQGTVAVDDETGNRNAVFTDDIAREFETELNIFTSNADTGVVLFNLPDVEERVAWVQVYSNTNLHVQTADTPRFRSSNRSHQIVLQLEQGRLRLTVPENMERTITLQVITPQGEVWIDEPGQYALEVANVETRLVVLKGAAALRTAENQLTLLTDELGMIPLDEVPVGPFDTERNLLRNSDFTNDMADWTLLAWNIELPDQPEGTVTSGTVTDEPALRFYRLGTGHADVAVRQTLEQDVADFSSLRLEATMIIRGQDVAVCGVRGSECPLTVRLEYVDENGVSQIWQQGFYAVGDIAPNQTPDICVSCAVVQPPHVNVNLNQLAFFELDILAELARQGYLAPTRLKSITLIAAGHSFEVDVVQVGLFGKE